ncbi:MAG TPA: cytochrome c oxidase subunit II [bacterium]
MFREVSDTAVLVDRSLVFIIGTAIAFLAVVTALMLYFVVRYRASRHPVAENPDREGSTALEVAWTVAATLLVILMFWFGWRDFAYLRTPPADALRVRVTAQEWSWRFTYAGGRESDVLRVPLGRPTRLDMTSLDVIHSAYIPAFRIKEDVVPGMTTHLWFTPKEAGKYDLFCTEYCGEGHSHMRAVVDVVPEAAFAVWLGEGAAAGPPQGEAVLKEKGCLGCHAIDGPGPVAPGFRGLYGSTVTVVTGGAERTIPADEPYLRRSIVDPAADVVKGYPNIMPRMPLDSAELDAVVAALKALGGTRP